MKIFANFFEETFGGGVQGLGNLGLLRETVGFGPWPKATVRARPAPPGRAPEAPAPAGRARTYRQSAETPHRGLSALLALLIGSGAIWAAAE